MATIMSRQTMIMNDLTKMGHVDETLVSDTIEFLRLFRDFWETVMERMEKTSGN